VATHRHRDHISGFATAKGGKGPGDIIASLKPDVVIQPWTEDPKAARNAQEATTVLTDAQAFVRSLGFMQQLAGSILTVADSLHGADHEVLRQLRFLGDDNLKNRSAVVNLMTMSKRRAYVHFGSKSGLERVLPGVKVRVLGPPTLKQSQDIRAQRAKDATEFWHLRSLVGAARLREAAALFPRYAVAGDPPYARWLRRRLHDLHAEELLAIVRVLDEAMNNTSVILLFEVGQKRFLFSGDAQIENWAYALSQPNVQTLLKGVNVYKVGHHGSLNATPKSMWALFKNRSKSAAPGRLRTLVSTMPGKHGSKPRNTEVPRETLVKALKRETEYFTTESLAAGSLSRAFEIPLSGN
jgi:hypothetical protein